MKSIAMLTLVIWLSLSSWMGLQSSPKDCFPLKDPNCKILKIV